MQEITSSFDKTTCTTEFSFCRSFSSEPNKQFDQYYLLFDYSPDIRPCMNETNFTDYFNKMCTMLYLPFPYLDFSWAVNKDIMILIEIHDPNVNGKK